MHGRSRFRTRARGSGAALSPFLFEASTYGATDAWDFVNDQYIRGGLLSDGGISITRNSVGSAQTADGRIVTFSAGELRRTDKGILVEGARTNLFLNSLVGATQTITVTAVAHTLSFYGTGTITLSGTSTAGPLVGTGAGQRVTLTFTPTAGSLTLTVSGTVEYVQLEVGAFASSWIPTEGASVQRAADVVTAVPSSGTDYPLTLFGEWVKIADDGVSFSSVIIIDIAATASDDARIVHRHTTNAARAAMRRLNVFQADLTFGTAALNVVQRAAVRFETDNIGGSLNGGAVVKDTTATMPSAPDIVRLGNRNLADPLQGYLRAAAIIPRAFSDAELQGLST